MRPISSARQSDGLQPGLAQLGWPRAGLTRLRGELASGRRSGEGLVPSGNLIPGPEAFSICQIGFPFWFQSEDKPGPAVSGPPRCPPPSSGCLCLPPRQQSPQSHLCSPFPHSAGGAFLNTQLKDALLQAAARDLVWPTAPDLSPWSLRSSPFHLPRNSLLTLFPPPESCPWFPLCALQSISTHVSHCPEQVILGLPVCRLPSK